MAQSVFHDGRRELDQVFAVIHVDGETLDVPAAIQELADRRLEARIARDFKQADVLRAEIQAAGWRVDDTPKGTRLSKDS